MSFSSRCQPSRGSGKRWIAGAVAATLLLTSVTAEAQREVVDLTGPRDRVTRQLRRELEASGFVIATTGTNPTARVVHVDLRAGEVVLMTRTPGQASPIPQARFRLDARDEVSVRRAALAVVEQLRLRRTAPSVPVPVDVAEPAPPKPQPATTTSEPMQAQASPLSTTEPEVLPPWARSWSLGAAPTLDLAPGLGDTTSHVQITGETPLGNLVGTVRALWPLLGTQRNHPDRSIRLWTTGAALGLRLPLRGREQRQRSFQPYLAASSGLRLVLADTDWFDYRHGRVGLTPAVVGTVAAGARHAVFPLVHLTFEVAGELSRTLPSASPPADEREMAEAAVIRTSLGLSFDY